MSSASRRARPARRGAILAGIVLLACVIDLLGQRPGDYRPYEASEAQLAEGDAYLAVNLAPLPDGWTWARRAVPGGYVRTGEAGVPGAPTVLFVPGFTGTAEQYADYYAAWRARGWRVVSLDLPGQGGSMRRPHVPGEWGNPELPWSDDFGAYADAIAPVLTEEAARGPLVVVGESFGGHVVLRALAEGAHADAAVLVVPALDAETNDVPRALALGVAHTAKALGFGGAYAAGTGPWAPGAGLGDGKVGRCGDRMDRLGVQAALYAREPSLRVSGPNWGWLAGLQASGARLAKPDAMASVTLPVLMVQSGQDQVVRNERAAAACAAMSACMRMVWDDTSHCLGVEEQEIQDRLHGVIERAVAAATG